MPPPNIFADENALLSRVLARLENASNVIVSPTKQSTTAGDAPVLRSVVGRTRLGIGRLWCGRAANGSKHWDSGGKDRERWADRQRSCTCTAGQLLCACEAAVPP
jgi:hypothetical protein